MASSRYAKQFNLGQPRIQIPWETNVFFSRRKLDVIWLTLDLTCLSRFYHVPNMQELVDFVHERMAVIPDYRKIAASMDDTCVLEDETCYHDSLGR